LSQIGGRAVRLQVQKIDQARAFAFHSIGSNDVPSCEPSQNGCDFERPQRHHQSGLARLDADRQRLPSADFRFAHAAPPASGREPLFTAGFRSSRTRKI